MIQLRHVKIGHHDTLLRAEDLKLSSGNIYALIGRNGIGKSTFIQTITGLIKPLAGEIVIDGKSISGFKINDIAETISLVDTRFDEVYSKGLNVMDLTAFTLCKENNLPIIVFDMDTIGNLKKLMSGEKVGTIVCN